MATMSLHTRMLLGFIAEPLFWIGLVLTAWCAYFFRDPERVTPQDDDLVIISEQDMLGDKLEEGEAAPSAAELEAAGQESMFGAPEPAPVVSKPPAASTELPKAKELPVTAKPSFFDRMLEKIGLLEADDLIMLKTGLKEIYLEIEKGQFKIEEGVEDVHSQVEFLLTERYGEVGKKLHSGRSRNDQVLVDLKLYYRAAIREI
mgnify:CR=1 FL=1